MIIKGNGQVDAADHRAMQPRPDQIWRTAWGELNSMHNAAIENYKADPSEYNRGRMNALGDASERLLERWVKA